MPIQKAYKRVMLGRQSVHATDCFEGNFIGADFGIDEDLSDNLSETWQEFNKKYIPIWLADRPHKSKVSAGLSCGALWTICKGLRIGDVVLCPDGLGSYRVGEVVGDYKYVPGEILPHRRSVAWLDTAIARDSMSVALRNSTGSLGTVADITGYAEEIERFLEGAEPPVVVSSESQIEDLAAFAMESHLEHFLVANWAQTDFGNDYTIFEEDGEMVGKQYETDAGRIDILAISRDKKRFLVIELKRGRSSDVVVGQLLRYMGYVKEQLAEEEQVIEGAIIALEEDQRLRWAISLVPSAKFYRYEINFRLICS